MGDLPERQLRESVHLGVGQRRARQTVRRRLPFTDPIATLAHDGTCALVDHDGTDADGT